MTTIYNCECCRFYTNHKTKYNKHLQTKKHLESTKSQHRVNKKSTSSQHKVNIFECKYCFRAFTTKQSMYRHIKFTCKQNKHEDMEELVRLLNQKNEIKDKQMENMQKQIDKLSNKLQIQNIQHIHNNTINYNIKLLNYSQTDYSHLTEQDYMKCIKDCNYCVKTLIEKVHFNESKPENKNIYISNIKNKYIMVYKNDKWQLVDRKDQIDDIYDYNEVVLENWYSENKDKHPELIRSFEKYLQNKDDNSMLNKIKEDILLLLYNNRMIEMI